jgi:RNA polymerase sigma-70 factor (ECF subfamily)
LPWVDSQDMGPSDRELIERFRAGRRDAFTELMARNERRIYNLAYRMLGGAEDARDATQDAFLSCYKNLAGFRGEAEFSTWMHRIAVNACYDLLRRRRQTVSLDEEPAEGAAVAVPDHADRAVAAADVQRALMTLPAEFRAVLIMHELQDLPLEEIAATLEIPVGTVKSRLHRGRAGLGRALAGEPRGAKDASKGPTR